jgi:glycosyltransferase involved in cell wall biosynthesis
MKVVYLANSVIPSRAANSIQVMKNCEAFASLGHDVTLLVPDRDEEEPGVDDIYEYYGVEPSFDVEKRSRPSLSSFGTLLANYRLGRAAVRLDPDLVYGRTEIACYVASLGGAPVAFESHVPVAESRFGKIRAEIFRRLTHHATFERLVVISEALREYYETTYPHLADRIVVAPNGADLPTDADPATNLETADRLQVGYVGHLYQGRGMEVIASLAERFPDLDFHVVGGNPEDVATWEGRLAPLQNLTFHGFVPQRDLDRYRAAFDVQVAPYQWDVATDGGQNTVQWMSPLKIIEYLSAGKPIVASDMPAIREILDDGETALLCDPEDVDEWAAAIERLRDDPELRERLGEQAMAEYRSTYTLEQRAETVLTSPTATVNA